MYQISELARQAGLSRSTLLYYEKIGLIRGRRMPNGYRAYDELDLQRLRLIRELRAGGLHLKEIATVLAAKLDPALLRRRLGQLDREIAEKQRARNLLAGLLGERSLTEWHMSLNALAPDAHLDWLITQGFSDKDALRLKWLSKDMNEHETYMTDFMKIFETLERWGPGSEADTLRALAALPATATSGFHAAPTAILDIGCGKGLSTVLLAANTAAEITAVDNEPTALDALQRTVAERGLAHRVTGVCASMTDLPFEAAAFDLIWAEGSAYIMGVERALTEWKRFLSDHGFLVVSDLVWLTDSPATEAQEFWKGEYPDMQTVAVRRRQIRDAGYTIVDDFGLSSESWNNYIDPLRDRIAELVPVMESSAAVNDIRTELKIYECYLGTDFGYQFFVLQKGERD